MVEILHQAKMVGQKFSLDSLVNYPFFTRTTPLPPKKGRKSLTIYTYPVEPSGRIGTFRSQWT